MPRVTVDGDATFERSGNIFLRRIIYMNIKRVWGPPIRHTLTCPVGLIYYDFGMFWSPCDIKENAYYESYKHIPCLKILSSKC